LPKNKPLVIVTQRVLDAVKIRMMELFDARMSLDAHPFDRAALKEEAAADILVSTVTDRIDTEIMAAASDALGLMANYGTGVDHINLAAAHGRDITGIKTPDVLTENTVDMTMAMILTRRLSEGERLMRVSE